MRLGFPVGDRAERRNPRLAGVSCFPKLRDRDSNPNFRIQVSEAEQWLERNKPQRQTDGSGSSRDDPPPDRLRAKSVGLQSGFTILETDGDTLHVPKVTGDVAAAWTSEGNAITPADPTFSEDIAVPQARGPNGRDQRADR